MSVLRLERVVLASNNAGKLREMRALLDDAGVTLVAQAELGVPDAEEPHPTFIENALAKARHAAALSGLPALADDSGVCVPVLGGAPGVRSARYAADSVAGAAPESTSHGTGARERADAANNAKLVAALARSEDRRAYYYCALVLVRSADDPQPIIADGSWHGEIVDEPRGANGFGYDPHFLVADRGLTAAELDAAEKNRISHRGQAMRALLARLADARLIG